MAQTAGLESICRFGTDLLKVFMPPLCGVCGEALASGEVRLCRRCMVDIAAGAGVDERRVDLGGGRSMRVVHPLAYTAAVSRLIKDMKYSDRPGLSEVFAPFLALALTSVSLAAPLLVPVPLHAARRRERGYNQSELLAAGVAGLTGIEVAGEALRRVKNTAPQAALRGDRRPANLKGAFRSGGLCLAGRHIVLIDDVLTTGATLRECALALEDSQPAEVMGCVVASSA